MSIEVLVGMNKNTVSLCKQFVQSVIQSFYVIQTCFPFLIKEEERKEKKKKSPKTTPLLVHDPVTKTQKFMALLPHNLQHYTSLLVAINNYYSTSFSSLV